MMDNMVFALWVSDRLEFSDDDKRACFDTVNTIVGIAEDVRRNGILSIDEKIPSFDGDFLKAGLQLAVDSTGEAYLRDIMQNWIIFGNYRGKELLERILILDGVIRILNGDNPRVIQIKLSACFGYDMAVKYNVYREGTFPQFSLETYLESVKDKQAHDDPTTQRLEKLLIGLDNMATQHILRNSEQEALILSLKVMSGQLMRHILGNMSSRVAQLLAEEASHRMNIRGRDIEAAQERIIATVDNLVKRGEIIISP